MKIFKDDCKNDEGNVNVETPDRTDVLNLEKLVWTQPSLFGQSHHITKIKCLSIQILSKIRANHIVERYLEILDLAFHDKDEKVQAEAIISMPVIVFYSGGCLLEHCFRRLE